MNTKPTTPRFYPHAGSPVLVDEEDGPYGADSVDHPSHYQSSTGLEAIQCIEAATEDLSGFEGYCTGNAMKYLFRWHKKGGVEDLRKAQWYLDRLIKGR